MNLINPHPRKKLASPVWWSGAGTMALGLMFGGSAVFAAAPPALTNIGNTASASFLDSSGKPNIVTSNPVVTVVQQVGAFALDGVTGPTTTIINTKTVTAGGTVYAPHVLTNTGNGSDSFNISVESANKLFSKIEIFADDGSGNPSGAPLCSTTGSAICTTSAPVTAAGGNGVYKFVVAYTLAATATTGATPYDSATITVTPIAASTGLYATPSASAKDAVNLTTGAAFTMGKSISAPAVAAPGGGAWPAAVVGGKASTSATCQTTWSSTLASTPTCTYTVYTLTISNIGAAAGRFAMTDQLPAGLTYVAGSAVWSSAPGTALTDASQGDASGIDYQYSGGKIAAVVASIAPNVSQTLSFVVLVNNTASVGTASTTNIGYYNSGDAGPTATSNVPGPVTTPTGTTPYTVSGSYGVVVGAVSSTSVTALDAVPGTPNGTPSDTTTVAQAVAGSLIKFEQKVYNTGDSTDTINLTVSPGSFPTGTTFFLFSADGATPLYDTGALDGVLDTGPLPAGGSTTVVVAAFLPSGLPVGVVNYSAVLTGTSQSSPQRKDATLDTLTSISRGLVDLTNTAAGNGTAGATANGDVGPGPSPAPTTVNTTTPGTPTGFNLYVANNDVAARSYTLAASASPNFPGNLPANWTVKFVAGADNACLPATAGITETGSIASNGQAVFTACVTPGPQQGAVTALKIYFKVVATTANNAGVVGSDTKTDAVTVNPSTAARFAALLVGSNTGELSSPGSVVYSHILTNTGLETCGPYTLQVALAPADIVAGWTYAVYLDLDGNGQIGAGDQLVTGQITTPLLTGAANARKILVRIGAPGGLPVGTTGLATVTAVFAAPNSCGSPSVVDLTTVTTGSIRVYKGQALDQTCDGVADATPAPAQLDVKPGSCIYYHVTAVNEGVAPVGNLTVTDRAPAYTTLSATQPTVKCSATNITGTPPVFATVGTEVSCGSSANVLNPGGTVSLDYTVIIDR